MLKIYLLFILLISNCFADYQYELSVCTIFRDEAPYLKEWIEFHRMLGVDHFYLCNHASKDNYREVLDPYIREGIVELTESSAGENVSHQIFCYGVQLAHLNETLVKARGVSKWVAFIDADEFLFPTEGNSLTEFLREYENVGGIIVNWFMFGTSFVDKIPNNKLMIEVLTRCSKTYYFNDFYKSIVQPDRALYFSSPHYPIYREGYTFANPNGGLVQDDFNFNKFCDRIRVNHYWCRDEGYFFNVKIPRQIAFGSDPEITKSRNDEMNREEDFAIQRFVPELRKRVGLD